MISRFRSAIRGGIAARLHRLVADEQDAPQRTLVALQTIVAARSLAAYGEVHAVPPPVRNRSIDPKTIKIGLFGNLANNHYVIAKGLRQAGYDAELVLQDGGIDRHPLAQPFWEDVPFECERFEDAEIHRRAWRQPGFVRRTSWSEELQAEFFGRMSAVDAVSRRYQAHFGRTPSPDVALLLAQNMGHWEYLSQMTRYDVVVLSAAAIALGAFVPCPYAVFPTGGDLTSAPFDEGNLEGVLMRAGYRRCSRILLGSPYWREALAKMGVLAKDVCTTLLLDTDLFRAGDGDALREAWRTAIGGTIFVHSTCRQDWFWKGNDKLLRAFAALAHPQMRLVLTRWGDDLARSRALVEELGIAEKTLWLPIASKPIVRTRQQAADIVVDQLTMGSFGTSVIESLAAGKPVVMRLEPPHMAPGDYQLPPVISATSEADVLAALAELAELRRRDEIGRGGRDWAVANRSYANRAEPFARELVEMVRQ